MSKANYPTPNPDLLNETAFIFSRAEDFIGLGYHRTRELCAYGQECRIDNRIVHLEWCWIRGKRGTSVEAFNRFQRLLSVAESTLTADM